MPRTVSLPAGLERGREVRLGLIQPFLAPQEVPEAVAGVAQPVVVDGVLEDLPVEPLGIRQAILSASDRSRWPRRTE